MYRYPFCRRRRSKKLLVRSSSPGFGLRCHHQSAQSCTGRTGWMRREAKSPSSRLAHCVPREVIWSQDERQNLRLHRVLVRTGDQSSRWRSATTRLPYRKPCRRHPILPFSIHQPCRNGAMPGQSDHYRDKTVVTIETGDMALAVGRVRQAVQQHHCADRRTIGLKHV
jgi:hypothetical protein